MGDPEKNLIRNAAVLAGGMGTGTKNAPRQYGARKRQYLDSESAAFIKRYAKYASDFFDALAQGLRPNDPMAWDPVSIRLADLVNPSATMARKIDDYKLVLVADEWVEYIKPGTKFVTMGSTWLCTNPENISGACGSGTVERCNAVWNHLDYYGNLLSEPLVVTNSLSKASSSDPQGLMLITKGYFNVKCQYNEQTAQLNVNSRILLGTGAYTVTGFSDFLQEFTGDDNSVGLLEFTIRYEEPNPEIDDLERHVAGGKQFSWEIQVTGCPLLAVGNTAVFAAASRRCGEMVWETAVHPISYLWTTTDPSVARVDALGTVTAVGEGTCRVLCALAQNREVFAEYELAVAQSNSGPRVAFLSEPPGNLDAYESVKLTCGCFLGEAVQGEKLAWSFSGADEGSYSAQVEGNTVEITCWAGDTVPLTVTAAWKGAKATAVIRLHGL